MNITGEVATPEGRLSTVVETLVDRSQGHDITDVAQQALALEHDAAGAIALLESLGWERPEESARQVDAVALSDLGLLRSALDEYKADDLLPSVMLSELVHRHGRDS